MKAEILCVGTELLLGDILNTNTQYLSQQLALYGIDVYYQSVVGDNDSRLKELLEQVYDRSDLVITTGGLGPTEDDLTKETIASFFQRKLVLHEETLEELKAFFSKRGAKVNEGNKKQAYLPEGSIILHNDKGTAPGCIIEENNKIMVMLPGPPREMQHMFQSYVVPFLKECSMDTMESKLLRVFGIGEGHMEEKIQDIIHSQGNPTIAPYAKDHDCVIRITAKAETSQKCKEKIQEVEKKIRARLGEYIYSSGEETLDQLVPRLLVEKGITISMAESCTGGMLSSMLVEYPGVSKIFQQGFVTYSNEAKIKYVQVQPETLETYGAVSEQTAAEMAQGAAQVSQSHIGVGITGIAGPGGGTEEKPVGLVYVGLYYNGQVQVQRWLLNGDRQRIRKRTCLQVLDWIRRTIQ